MSKDPSDFRSNDSCQSSKRPAEDVAGSEKAPQDGDATEDLYATKQVIEGVEGYFFKKKLKEIHKKLVDDSTGS
jgi:hypothetical protein